MMADEKVDERIRELETRVAALESKMAKHFGATEMRKPTSATASGQPSRTLVAMTLDSKRFVPGEYGDDRVDMDLTLTLSLDSLPTRAVKGQLVFTDLFGDVGFKIGYTVNDPLRPGVALAVRGVGFDFNQFASDHNWMLGTDVEDMLCYFEIRSIIFQDGTSESF